MSIFKCIILRYISVALAVQRRFGRPEIKKNILLFLTSCNSFSFFRIRKKILEHLRHTKLAARSEIRKKYDVGLNGVY